jgi:branched-chain amino acid transport system substrate-binding protein
VSAAAGGARTIHPDRRRLLGACAAFAAFGSRAASAPILIGQTTGLTGPVSSGATENTAGASLYLDHVNSNGGVDGQRIELISMDDRFDPALAAANAMSLIQRKVIALFLNRGTPHTEAIRGLLAKFSIPLVAPSAGAMSLHRPVDPWIFNVRAPYQREAEKAVSQLVSSGTERIGVAYVNDSFGNDGLAGAQSGFAATRTTPSFTLAFDRQKPNVSELATTVVQKNAQAVLFIGTAAAVAAGAKAIRAAGSKAQIVTLSNNASSGFIELMGPYARGTIVTQVFPSERALAVPMVKEAIDLARAQGRGDITPAMLEGFAAGKVLVAGLRRCGPNPNGVQLRDALEGLRKLDIGGLTLSYDPANHTGLRYADLSIIDATGKFRR